MSYINTPCFTIILKTKCSRRFFTVLETLLKGRGVIRVNVVLLSGLGEMTTKVIKKLNETNLDETGPT